LIGAFYKLFIYEQGIKMSLWDLLHDDLKDKIIDMRDEINNYDTMFKKLTNDFLRNYIQTHFKSKGKRLTNLSKAKKEHLLQLFTEYNIPKVPFETVVRPIEDKIDSKCKFEVGTYTYTYAFRWDELLTTNYHLKINIHKITQFYVFLDVSSQFKNECNKNKLWIDKLTLTESIKFGIFYIRASDLVLIT
jgi:hypothetical protein